MPVTDEITELRSGPISRTCSPDNPGQEQDQASSMGKGFITTVLAPFRRSTASRDSRKGPAGQRIAREQLAAEEGSHSPAKRGAAEHHHVSDEYTSENNHETEANRAVFKAGHYEGSTVDGKRHGEGIFSLSNGQRYTGTWANDMREGKGVEKWPDGRSYHGAWKQDAFDGEGVFTWADSTSFKGTFRDYCPLEGEIFAPNGDVFVVLYDGSEPVFAGDKPEPLYKKLLSARQPEQAAEDKKDLEERVQVMRVFSAMLRDRWLQACEGGMRILRSPWTRSSWHSRRTCARTSTGGSAGRSRASLARSWRGARWTRSGGSRSRGHRTITRGWGLKAMGSAPSTATSALSRATTERARPARCPPARGIKACWNL
jgi:hypothetical protein